MAYDPQNEELYVADTGKGGVPSASVTVINASTYHVVATVAVGGNPDGVTYDSLNGRIYVSNGGNQGDSTGANSVSVISPTTNTVVSTIPVGGTPVGIVVDPSTGLLYVGNWGTFNFSVINPTSDSVAATIVAGPFNAPETGTWDPSSGDIYFPSWDAPSVPNPKSNLTAIDPRTNTVAGEYPILGTSGLGIAYDPLNNALYVSSATGSPGVGILNGTTLQSVANFTPPCCVGDFFYDSLLRAPLLVNPSAGLIEEVNGSSNVIDTNFTTPGISDLAIDSANGEIFYSDDSNNTVGFLFPTSGAPALLSVTVTPPSATVAPSGSQSFTATPACSGPCPAGITYSWTLTNALGVLSSGVGPTVDFTAGTTAGVDTLFVNASLNKATVRSAAVPLQISSSASVSVTFTESGLPYGTSWSVDLNAVSLSSTTSTITFTEPQGLTYTYGLSPTGGLYPWPAAGSTTPAGGGSQIPVTFGDAFNLPVQHQGQDYQLYFLAPAGAVGGSYSQSLGSFASFAWNWANSPSAYPIGGTQVFAPGWAPGSPGSPLGNSLAANVTSSGLLWGIVDYAATHGGDTPYVYDSADIQNFLNAFYQQPTIGLSWAQLQQAIVWAATIIGLPTLVVNAIADALVAAAWSVAEQTSFEAFQMLVADLAAGYSVLAAAYPSTVNAILGVLSAFHLPSTPAYDGSELTYDILNLSAAQLGSFVSQLSAAAGSPMDSTVLNAAVAFGQWFAQRLAQRLVLSSVFGLASFTSAYFLGPQFTAATAVGFGADAFRQVFGSFLLPLSLGQAIFTMYTWPLTQDVNAELTYENELRSTVVPAQIAAESNLLTGSGIANGDEASLAFALTATEDSLLGSWYDIDQSLCGIQQQSWCSTVDPVNALAWASEAGSMYNESLRVTSDSAILAGVAQGSVSPVIYTAPVSPPAPVVARTAIPALASSSASMVSLSYQENSTVKVASSSSGTVEVGPTGSAMSPSGGVNSTFLGLVNGSVTVLILSSSPVAWWSLDASSQTPVRVETYVSSGTYWTNTTLVPNHAIYVGKYAPPSGGGYLGLTRGEEYVVVGAVVAGIAVAAAVLFLRRRGPVTPKRPPTEEEPAKTKETEQDAPAKAPSTEPEKTPQSLRVGVRGLPVMAPPGPPV